MFGWMIRNIVDVAGLIYRRQVKYNITVDYPNINILLIGTVVYVVRRYYEI
jgi:hypothetical protein